MMQPFPSAITLCEPLMMGTVPGFDEASPFGGRQLLGQWPSVRCFHVNGPHSPQGHFVRVVGKSLDVADQTADRKHDPCSFERRRPEKIVRERVRHTEQ